MEKYRTPERDEVMRRMYPTKTPPGEIAAALSALEGPPVSPHEVSRYADRLGLRRPREYFQAIGMSLPPAQPKKPAPVSYVLPDVEADADTVARWARANRILPPTLPRVNEARRRMGLPGFAVRRRVPA